MGEVGGGREGERRSRIELLGGFGLACDERPVSAPLSVQRLLALLALHERPIQRPYVAGMLWLELPEERALASLRSALWRVRQVDPGLVTARNGQLCISAGVEIDVRAMVSRARRLMDAGEPGVEKVVDEGDLAGELLPDWYDDWVLLERERLRQLRLHALESLTERLVRAGRHGEAVEAGIAAVRCEPLRESAHRVLIDVYLSEGNYGEALRQYRWYSDLLDRELGLEPSSRMRDQVAGLMAP